jgi:hypothetical protein
MSKGQIPIIELTTTILVLLVAFSVLFPEFSYKSKWEDALLFTRAKDSILTIDRIGNLYSYSFNPTLLENFLKSVYPGENLITWFETEGTFKGRIIVACNCTAGQIEKLNSWFGQIQLNNRSITINFLTSNLDVINEPSDALLIWGYKDLTNYRTPLQNYLNKGNGIVEITDLSQAQANNAQQQIFGVKWYNPGGGWGSATEDTFIRPVDAKKTNYGSYKNFNHIPIPLLAPILTTSIPNDSVIPECLSSNINQGNFTFRGASYNFWICNGGSVYFDTNGNNMADIRIIVGNSFTINNFKFLLNYMDDNERIRVSFKPVYNFTDFLQAGGSRVYPVDDDVNKILLSNGNWISPSRPIPAVILNGTVGKTAWVADFSRNGLDEVEDDHKSLLLSLLLWTSNKRVFEVSPNLKVGLLNSYISTENKDIFEVYRFNLGLGFPF